MTNLLRCLLPILFVASLSSCTKVVSLGDAPDSTSRVNGVCGALINGNYNADSALNFILNSVIMTHDYRSTGNFIVSTNTVNGYSFRASVSINAYGPVQLTLRGYGTPIVNGTDSFIVNFGDGSNCHFTVNVGSPNPPPPPGGGGSGGCISFVAGFLTGYSPGVGNVGTGSHTYTSSGPFGLTTDTVNGLMFSGASFSGGGATTVSIYGSGTALAAGTFTYTLNFGDGTNCTFTITVTNPTTGPVVTGNYFPLTDNSYWTYDNHSFAPYGDTFIVKNQYPQIFNGQTYRAFVLTDAYGIVEDTLYYRKDATGMTYRSVILDDELILSNITFPAGQRYDVPVVKDALSQNENWVSPTYVAAGPVGPVSIRFYYTCLSTSTSETINGRTFNNVAKIESVININTGLGWTGSPVIWRKQWFAPGVGLLTEVQLPSPNPPTSIRNYQVF
jgi:hypothetical protein